jgi:NADH-quinone oxidoreductase subunit J
MLDQISFFVVSAIILIFAVMSVTSRRILRSAVYLMFVLIATAVLYFMMGYNFLAAVQLTVYAGGIVVLIIFSILLTSHISERAVMAPLKQKILSSLAAVAGALLVLMVVLAFDFKPSPASIADSSIQSADSATLVVANATAGTAQASSNIHDIGLALVSYEREGFALPFEVVSILLLAALIGAIVLAKKEKLPINTEISDNTNNDSTL